MTLKLPLPATIFSILVAAPLREDRYLGIYGSKKAAIEN
jgi:hypothetical protein